MASPRGSVWCRATVSLQFAFISLPSAGPGQTKKCVFEFSLGEMNTFVHLHWPGTARDAIWLTCVRVISFPFQMFLMFE